MNVAAPCIYPEIHTGWGGSGEYIEDCGSTAAIEAPVDHDLKCIIYFAVNCVIFLFCMWGVVLTIKNPPGISLQTFCFRAGAGMTVVSMIATTDVDAAAGRLPYVLYHLFCSVNGALLVITVININLYLIQALRKKGGDSKDVWYKMKRVSEVMGERGILPYIEPISLMLTLTSR